MTRFAYRLTCLAIGGTILSAVSEARAQFQGLGLTVTSPAIDLDYAPILDLQSGDIDRDGLSDLAFVTDYGNIAYIRGRADRLMNSVVLVTNFTSDENGRALELVDYDQDSDLDIIRIAQLDGGEARMYRNNGTGGFQLDFAISGLGTLAGRFGSVTADFDNDGDKDLVVLTSTGVKIIQKIPGGFSLTPITATFTNFAGLAIDAGDMDGDGRVDVAVLSDTLDDIVLLRSNGSTYVEANRIPFDANGRDLKLVDMDSDGDPDLVASSVATDRIRVYRNTGGTYAFAYSVATYDPREVEIADMDADGDMDFVALCYGGPAFPSHDRVVVYLNGGAGFFNEHLTSYDMLSGDTDTIALFTLSPSSGIDVAGGYAPNSNSFISVRPNLTPFVGPTSFVLNSPPNNAINLAPPATVSAWGGRTHPHLEWEHPGGFNVTYRVRVSRSDTLAAPVFDRDGLTDRVVDLGTLVLDPGTRYYWGVTASNSAGNSTAGPFNFTTASGASACRADIDGSGAVSVQDVFSFLVLYFAGCP